MNIELAADGPRATRICGFAGLCGLYASIHFNRQIVGILANSVKSDLKLSDQELGMLTGSAFSIVFALLGLYFGMIADARNRLTLARTGAVVWSAASVAAGLSPTYAILVVARAGLALGEAIAAAAIISLMSQLAGERLRASAFSVFASTAMAGAGAAVFAGGQVLGLHHGWGGLAGWRLALIASAIPGSVIGLFLGVFRWREPARANRASIGGATLSVLIIASVAVVLLQISLQPSEAVPIAIALAAVAGTVWLVRLRRVRGADAVRVLYTGPFYWLLVSFAAVLFVDSAANFWLIPYVQRQFGLAPSVAGSELGGLLILGGIVGCLAAGWWADRWQRRSDRGRTRAALLIVLAEGLFVLLALDQSTHAGFLVAFALFCLTSGGWTGVVTAIAMDVLPVGARGAGTGIYFLFTTLLGPGLGAFVVGTVSDAAGSLRTGLASSCGILIVAVFGLARLIRSESGSS